MVQAIPRRYLPHIVTYIRREQGSRGKTVLEEIEIENVRMEFNVIESDSTSVGRGIDGKHIMFYDLSNSYPNDIEFELDDSIVFDGEEFRIVDVLKLSAFKSTPHHLEVVLK